METKDIIFGFLDIWNSENEFYSVQGTVKDIDTDVRTCTVTPVDGGPDILDVRLEAEYTKDTTTDPKGLYIQPAVGSVVIVTFMDKNFAFLSAYTEIDKVITKQSQWIFNDGSNLGLINIVDLTAKLNNLISETQGELFKISVAFAGVGGSYTPGILTVLNKDDYEDDTVTH